MSVDIFKIISLYTNDSDIFCNSYSNKKCVLGKYVHAVPYSNYVISLIFFPNKLVILMEKCG